ncbi:MAG: hypothetical protein K6B28_11045 [Lachnospiraceae bacterium]|nr:hypothetical protein [Lachnospiraceae bacterium]
MKFIFVIALTAITVVLLLLKKEYRSKLILGYVLVLILLNIVYDTLFIHIIVPFYRPFSQCFYQTGFLERGEFPDSLLSMLLKDKKVYVKDDKYGIDEAKAEGKDYVYSYYHMVNAVNYAEFSGAEVIKDSTMNGTMVSDERLKNDFEKLGYANDMFRYTFLMNDYVEELGNYFTYFWYYFDHLSDIYAYINTGADSRGEDISEAEELVILWDSSKTKEEENIYVMTKTYYEDNIRNGNLDQ